MAEFKCKKCGGKKTQWQTIRLFPNLDQQMHQNRSYLSRERPMRPHLGRWEHPPLVGLEETHDTRGHMILKPSSRATRPEGETPPGRST